MAVTTSSFAVGFALTLLQRRLASSPEAIRQSLRRRHQASDAATLTEHRDILWDDRNVGGVCPVGA